jgi:hypothetical protein
VAFFFACPVLSCLKQTVGISLFKSRTDLMFLIPLVTVLKIHTYIHSCMHTYIRTHTYIHTHVLTYMYVCIMYVRTYIHTHTHTHTHIQFGVFVFWNYLYRIQGSSTASQYSIFTQTWIFSKLSHAFYPIWHLIFPTKRQYWVTNSISFSVQHFFTYTKAPSLSPT